MINASEISNGNDAIDNFWNEYKPQKVLDLKRGKYQNSLLTGDDRKLIMSRKSSRNFKKNFSNHKWKHNASLT